MTIFKSKRRINYNVPGRGVNYGEVEGKVISKNKKTVTIEDPVGNVFSISLRDFLTANQKKS